MLAVWRLLPAWLDTAGSSVIGAKALRDRILKDNYRVKKANRHEVPPPCVGPEPEDGALERVTSSSRFALVHPSIHNPLFLQRHLSREMSRKSGAVGCGRNPAATQADSPASPISLHATKSTHPTRVTDVEDDVNMRIANEQQDNTGLIQNNIQRQDNKIYRDT